MSGRACHSPVGSSAVDPESANITYDQKGILRFLYVTATHASSRPTVRALLGAACISPMPVLVTLANSGPVPTVVYRCGLALPVLGVIAIAEQRRCGPRSLASRGHAFLAGLFLAVDLVLFNHTITDAGAGVSTVIGSLYVPLVAVLAWLLLRERPSRGYLLTLPVVIAGIVLASGIVGGSGTGQHPGAGLLYGVAANIAYAGYLLILRQTAANTRHVAGQLFDATAGATAGAVLFGLIFGGLQLAVPWHALGWLLLLSLIVQVAGWLLITASLPQLPAALSSMLLLLQPAGAMLLAAIALSQRPTAIQLAGAAIACGGVVVAAVAKQKPSREIPTQHPPPLASVVGDSRPGSVEGGRRPSHSDA
jgi:drug/metabolite transporter (DMT)-like permease